MPKHSKPRAGSLQFWPRKRAGKFLPSVNWKAVSNPEKNSGIFSFIAYKVGMSSCLIKDSTPESRTKDSRIIIPVTILEAPPMKICSVRFYKNENLIKEILSENLEKELKKKIRLPKTHKLKIEDIKDYDNIRLIVYSLVKQTGIKKTPDLIEIKLAGNLDEKIKFVKENLNKEIFLTDFIKDIQLIDVRGLTKGKGIQGPVKRFGIRLKSHKSEKGIRNVGSIGPWHPAHTTFRTPMAGQLGMFSRIKYNSKIIISGKIQEKNINPKQGWKKYGEIKTEYIIIAGSVQGPQKRQLLLTLPLRPSKKQNKKNYEFMKLI
ncbi:MAG: 50S ribosomal protein L3 [Nanoarchaeota archaeon]|nr:50S ribosomal protein L3 [Nanoarchaeota archaeon]